MKLRSRILPIALIVVLAACAKVKDRSVLLRGVAMHDVRLELKHTNITDLNIRVPAGFVSEWTEEAHYDKFFLFEPKDTGDVQQGMVTLDITPDPAKLIPDTAKYQRSVGKMGEHEVQWRERTIVNDDGSKLFQREMVTHDLFAGLEKYGKQQGLVLHAFVVGSDSNLVERLTAVVETISLPPSKPNL
jgi:hypothetical protein